MVMVDARSTALRQQNFRSQRVGIVMAVMLLRRCGINAPVVQQRFRGTACCSDTRIIGA
jgi:hypothetical protein